MALPHRTFAAVAAPRRRPAARGLVGAGRRAASRSPSTTSARAAPRGWAAYVAGVLWALRRPGMRCAGSTSPSTARCRSGPGCPARRRWSARSRWRPRRPVRPAAWRGTTPGAPGLAAALRARPRTTSPGARPAAWTSPPRCAASAGHALLLDCRDGSARQVPFDLGGARAGAAGHRHPCRARAGRRPVRASAASPASRPPRSSASPACARCAAAGLDAALARRPRPPTSCAAGSGTWSPRSRGSGRRRSP